MIKLTRYNNNNNSSWKTNAQSWTNFENDEINEILLYNYVRCIMRYNNKLEKQIHKVWPILKIIKLMKYWYNNMIIINN